MEADRDYHIRRARDELDLAYRTEHVRAISAHLRLCALHIGQLQASGPSEPGPSRSTEPRLAEPTRESAPQLVGA